MATPIGRILLMPKGDYSASAVYNALDWVRHAGGAWVCTTDNTTNVTPALNVPEWQLMAQDGTVGGWSSIQNKPFETLGDGLYKNAADKLTIAVDNSMLLGSKLGVDVQNSYSSSSDKPINGQGVKAALDTIQDGTTIESFADVETAIAGKADKTEIVHWVDATLPSGSLSYNVSNSLFKTTSKIVGVLADGGGNYSSISIPSTGVFTITFSAALASSLSISIGVSNATSESGTVS